MFNNINFDYMENNNEIKKIDSSMVECPFCKNVIEAPSKPDVIFKCPKCYKGSVRKPCGYVKFTLSVCII